MNRNYYHRKKRELALLSAGHGTWSAESFTQQLEEKMEWAAARKSRFILDNPNFTETKWCDEPGRGRPYRFEFDYQRADIDVSGPVFYGGVLRDFAFKTLYTISGMAALNAALQTLKSLGASRLVVARGCYAETEELARELGFAIDHHVRNPDQSIKLLDSSAPGSPASRASETARFALFDTSCYSCTSGNVRRWARQTVESGSTAILVRSHTKLDALGIEYGRLGSVTVVSSELKPDDAAIIDKIASTIRLTGTAPIPQNFPPFAAEPYYHELSRGRVAQIMRNTRVLRQVLKSHGIASKCYHHGLFTTLSFGHAPTPEWMSQRAAKIGAQLSAEGLPVRHAGSFGFDFVSVEWFNDSSDRCVKLRIAPGDIPENVMIKIARRLARMLSATVLNSDSAAA